MDIYAILSVAVAIVTISSAYWLLNGVPDFLSGPQPRKTRRRPS